MKRQSELRKIEHTGLDITFFLKFNTVLSQEIFTLHLRKLHSCTSYTAQLPSDLSYMKTTPSLLATCMKEGPSL
jgi:hypothetical protein